MITLLKTTSIKHIKQINPDIQPNILNTWVVIKDNKYEVGLFEIQELTKITGIVHFYIKPEVRNQGYGKKMCPLLLRFAKEKTGFRKLIASIPAYNIPMIAVMKHTDFKCCGAVRDGIIWDDRLQDIILFEIEVQR